MKKYNLNNCKILILYQRNIHKYNELIMDNQITFWRDLMDNTVEWIFSHVQFSRNDLFAHVFFEDFNCPICNTMEYDGFILFSHVICEDIFICILEFGCTRNKPILRYTLL